MDYLLQLGTWFNSLLPQLQNLGFWGYWIVLLIFFFEAIVGIGLIMPGAIIAFLLGTLSARGGFHIPELILFASSGFLIGDILSFSLGRRGQNFFSAEARFLKLKHLEKGKEFFAKHGNLSVFLGRFLGFLRPLTPFIAGLAKMGWFRFLTLNILSIVAWVTIHIFAGFFFGQALWLIKLWSGRLEIFFIYALIIFGTIYLSKKLLVKNGQALMVITSSFWTSFKKAIEENKDIQGFINRHQTFFNFFRRRLTKESFSGRQLTTASLLFIYAALNFLYILNNIEGDGNMVSIDQRAESLINTFKNFIFIKTFLVITVLGNWIFLLALVIGTSIIFYLRGHRYDIYSLWVSFFGTIGSSYLLKELVARPRPLNNFYPESLYSFPSAHSALAVSFWGFIIYTLWKGRRIWEKKINALYFGLTLIFLIGFSRIYLRVHFLSDVLAGYLIGLSWLIVAIGINQYLHFGKTIEATKKPLTLKIKLVIASLALCEMAIFAGVLNSYISKINFNQAAPLQENITMGVLDNFNLNGLDKYSESFDGDHQEPLSFIISVDSQESLEQAFAKIGWQKADKPNFNALIKLVKNGALNNRYQELPVSPSFWETQVNDLAFTKKDDIERHYAKFWQTNLLTPNGCLIFVGIAGAKSPTKLIIKKKLKSDIDSEREWLFEEFKKAKLIASWSRHQFIEPAIIKKFLNELFTDGKLYIIDLR